MHTQGFLISIWQSCLPKLLLPLFGFALQSQPPKLRQGFLPQKSGFVLVRGCSLCIPAHNGPLVLRLKFQTPMPLDWPAMIRQSNCSVCKADLTLAEVMEQEKRLTQ